VIEALLELRRRHPRWGAKKLLAVLETRHPDWDLPARSTAHDLLRRHGLVDRKRRRPRFGHPGRSRTTADQPNELWTADFKGHFRMKNGRYCFPLTVVDRHSRFLLGCEALHSTCESDALRIFRRLFEEYGLPERIRTDNGVPFATYSLGRLSRLAVWWIRLGIRRELIDPGKPQQNGAHERMHKTLKARPPGRQNRTFGPSSAGSTPSARPSTTSGHTRRSNRNCPARFTRAAPASCPTVSRRSCTPEISRFGRCPATAASVGATATSGITTVLINEYVAFEEVDDGLWTV
jgi:putative transposase